MGDTTLRTGSRRIGAESSVAGSGTVGCTCSRCAGPCQADHAMNIVWAALIVAAAAGAAVAVMLLVRRRAPGGQLLRRQRPCRRHLRCHRHRVLRAARLLDLPRLRELRRLPLRRRDRGVDGRSADPDRAGPACRGRPELTGELVCYARYVTTTSGRGCRTARSASRSIRGVSPCSRRCKDVDLGSAAAGGGLREVAGPDLGPGAGPPGPHPRRVRAHADPAVDRPVLHRRRRAGRTSSASPTAASGPGSRACSWASVVSVISHHAAAPRLPGRPVRRRRRRPRARRHGAGRAPDRAATRRDRRRRHDPLRRLRKFGMTAPASASRCPPGEPRLGRDRRHRPARPRRGRDRLEQLPGQPLERRGEQGRPVGSTPCASTPPAPKDWPRARPRSTSPCTSNGSTPPRPTSRSWPTSTIARFRPEFRPAFDAWLATDPLDRPGRPADPVRHGRVPVAGSAPSPRRLDAEAAGDGGRRRPQPATIGQLRPRRRHVRRRPVLRRDEHQAARRRSAPGLLIVGCVVFIGTAAWIATFPVSARV